MIVWISTAAVACGIAGAIVWPRIRTKHQARQLHRELAEANGLTEDEARWLWRVATDSDLSDPLLVFVVPSVLESHAQQDQRLHGVQEKLFADC